MLSASLHNVPPSNLPKLVGVGVRLFRTRLDSPPSANAGCTRSNPPYQYPTQQCQPKDRPRFPSSNLPSPTRPDRGGRRAHGAGGGARAVRNGTRRGRSEGDCARSERGRGGSCGGRGESRDGGGEEGGCCCLVVPKERGEESSGVRGSEQEWVAWGGTYSWTSEARAA